MTIQGYRPQREPPRLFELWALMKTRLATATMNNALLGANRIYVPGDMIPEQEADQSQVWGRLVVAPVVTTWGTVEELGRHKLAPFLLRVDFHRPAGSRANVNRWCEAIHNEAFYQLHGWAPGADAMEYALVEHPIHREIAPQPSAVWDAENLHWFMSATYHVYVSPKRWRP